MLFSIASKQGCAGYLFTRPVFRSLHKDRLIRHCVFSRFGGWAGGDGLPFKSMHAVIYWLQTALINTKPYSLIYTARAAG
jgi:hypothetical protein